VHGTNNFSLDSDFNWCSNTIVCCQLFAQSESMDSQNIFLGVKRGISKDFPNEYHWWDVDWIVYGCKSILVVINIATTKITHFHLALFSLSSTREDLAHPVPLHP